jgi:hypothetical protein
VTAKTKLAFSLFKSLTARGLPRKSSSKRCIAGMIGTCRRSQFFVPVSGSSLTHIIPPLRSTSVHLTYPASPSLQPENAKNSIKSPHCWEHQAPAERTAEIKAVNSSRLGSSSCFARTLTLPSSAAGLLKMTPSLIPRAKIARRQSTVLLNRVAETCG